MDKFRADVVSGFFLKRIKAFSVCVSGLEHEVWKCLKSLETSTKLKCLKSLEASTKIFRHWSCESPFTYSGSSKPLWKTGTSVFSGYIPMVTRLLSSGFIISLLFSPFVFWMEWSDNFYSVCCCIFFWRFLLQLTSFLNCLKEKSALA